MLYIICRKYLINILNYKCNIILAINNNIIIFNAITHKIIFFLKLKVIT